VCENEWMAVFPDGAENVLECEECGSQNSVVLENRKG